MHPDGFKVMEIFIHTILEFLYIPVIQKEWLAILLEYLWAVANYMYKTKPNWIYYLKYEM